MIFNWTTEIKGKEYGASLGLKDNMTNQELNDFADVLSQQIKLTLQKIINGKSEIDELVQKINE